jgi:hypothetical protein
MHPNNYIIYFPTYWHRSRRDVAGSATSTRTSTWLAGFATKSRAPVHGKQNSVCAVWYGCPDNLFSNLCSFLSCRSRDFHPYPHPKHLPTSTASLVLLSSLRSSCPVLSNFHANDAASLPPLRAPPLEIERLSPQPSIRCSRNVGRPVMVWVASMPTITRFQSVHAICYVLAQPFSSYRWIDRLLRSAAIKSSTKPQPLFRCK